MQAEANATGFRGDVEGMRAVAILAVVLFHVNFFAPGGFVGVDVFFVISGLVITRSIVSHHRSDGRFSIGGFYVRRAKRILPALTLFLLVMVPATMLLGSPYDFPRSADTAAAAGLFVANIQLLLEGSSGYFGANADTNPFLHMWSLSVEEQFYVAFPALVAGCLLLARRRGRSHGDDVWQPIRLVFGGVLLLSLFAMVLVGESNRDAAFYLSPLRAWEFLAGAILALVPSVAGRWATPLRAVGLTLVLWSVVSLDSSAWPGLVTVVPVVGTMMVLVVAPGAGRLRGVLDNRVMRYLGGVSYGWYLWHWPMIVLGRIAFPHSTRIALVAGFAALIPAILSLRLVENPIRFSPLRRPRPVFAVSAASIVAVVLVAAVISPALNDRLPGSVAEIVEVADLDHIQHTDQCGDPPDTGPAEPELCHSISDADAPQAVLLGDSIGAQFAVPFHEAAQSQDWNGTVRTMLSCPFLPGLSVVDPEGIPFPGCNDHNRTVLAELVADPPDAVVISNNLTFALADTHRLVPVDPADNPLPQPRSAAIAEGLTSVVNDLEAAGTRVILVRRPPPSGNFAVYQCARWRWVWNDASCGASRSLDASLNGRATEDRIIDTVAAHTDAIVVDSAEVICASRCSPIQDGVWVYGDATHVTRQAGPLFTPMLEAALDAVDAGS